MKVILAKDVDNLGKEGEIKEVADGFARNYLIPKKLAVWATEGEVKNLEAKKQKKEKEMKMELEEAQRLAEQLDGQEFYVKVKEKDGVLFGSVNEKTIAAALKDAGAAVSPKMIRLGAPLKEIGEHNVQINLDHGLEANIRVILVGEEK